MASFIVDPPLTVKPLQGQEYLFDNAWATWFRGLKNVAAAAGVGTVTNVSVVAANGVSAVVANPATTPALTFALGNITPTSIVATGTVTGTNLSGNNTGDQIITLTGGVTGSGTGSFTATVITNANLTGPITSVGNTTSIASQTGTGTKFVMDTSPTLVTPLLGTPQSGNFSTGVFTWPTFNQSTTGSAATLTTPRSIYGNNFDGSAALGQIIASTFGGTGNGFTKFSGPTTAEKTFTLPNASAAVLTDNAAVTVAQGGTGVQTATTAYGLQAAGTTATGSHQTLPAGLTTQLLVGGGAAALPAWTTATGSGAPVRAVAPSLTGGMTVTADASAFGLSINGRAADSIGVLRFMDTTGATTQATLDSRSSGIFIASTLGVERWRTDSSGFLNVTGSIGRGAPVTKVANFAPAATENWIICNGGATLTVTLPSAATFSGREIHIKTIAAFTVVSASSNVVPKNSATAGTAILAAAAGNWATLVSDSTNWVVMAGT